MEWFGLKQKMMRKDPKKRIGAKNKDEIKNDPFFKNIDWRKVYEKKYNPPEDFVTYEEDTEVDCNSIWK